MSEENTDDNAMGFGQGMLANVLRDYAAEKGMDPNAQPSQESPANGQETAAIHPPGSLGAFLAEYERTGGKQAAPESNAADVHTVAEGAYAQQDQARERVALFNQNNQLDSQGEARLQHSINDAALTMEQEEGRDAALEAGRVMSNVKNELINNGWVNQSDFVAAIKEQPVVTLRLVEQAFKINDIPYHRINQDAPELAAAYGNHRSPFHVLAKQAILQAGRNRDT